MSAMSSASAEASEAFWREDYSSARIIFEQLAQEAADKQLKQDLLFNVASCHASEGNLEQALDLMSKLDPSDRNDLLCNKALCMFKLGQIPDALEQLDQIASNCRKFYPEVQRAVEQNCDDRSGKIYESQIVEALNLRAAAMYKLNKNPAAARQILNSIPIRSEEQLDCVTLHNQAIFDQSRGSFVDCRKLEYLKELAKEQDWASIVPGETSRNLLVAYLATGDWQSTRKLVDSLTPGANLGCSDEVLRILRNLVELLENSEEPAIHKLASIGYQLAHMSTLNPSAQPFAATIRSMLLSQVVEALWLQSQYITMENIIRALEPTLADSRFYRMSLAHSIYMQDTRYLECVPLYESLSHDAASLVEVDPMILANLCVAYIFTERIRDAESFIKDVEADEHTYMVERKLETGSWKANTNLARPGAPPHLFIIDLVIGTLYCAKFNYEYGLSRIFKKLDPDKCKLHPHAWYHAKRCILSLLDRQCKQMIQVHDDLNDKIVGFLMKCERGNVSHNPNEEPNEYMSVMLEARNLRSLVISLIHD